jgi:DNA-binding transcriptional LysR family regulator
MSAIELRHLQALVALTEEGTFTDAAIRLHVSQSAVSRTIVAFEQLAGARLVERTTRAVALTPAGKEAYRAAVVALGAADDVLDAARGRSRPLRFGYSWSALGRYTSTVLQRWRTAHPDVALEVHRVDERTGGLTRGLVDVAVVRGPLDEPDLVTRPIFREARMAVVPAAHPLAMQSSVDLHELAGSTILTTAYGTTTPELWPQGARPRAVLSVDNTDEWLTEIAGGLAVGVTTESTAAQHAHPGVRFVPLRDAAPVQVQLAWPARRVHPATEAFVALVVAVVSD